MTQKDQDHQVEPIYYWAIGEDCCEAFLARNDLIHKLEGLVKEWASLESISYAHVCTDVFIHRI